MPPATPPVVPQSPSEPNAKAQTNAFSSPSGGPIMALLPSGATFRVGRRAHEKMGPAEADPEFIPDFKPLFWPLVVQLSLLASELGRIDI